MMVSNDESKAKFKEKGYRPSMIVKIDGQYRRIYGSISERDAIEFVCEIGFVRAFLLERVRSAVAGYFRKEYCLL